MNGKPSAACEIKDMIGFIREVDPYDHHVVLHTLAKDSEVYLVYLPDGGSTEISLPSGSFNIAWLNTRSGEICEAAAMSSKVLTAPGSEDWLAVIRKN